MPNLSSEEVRVIVKEAVKETLVSIGVDVEDATEVQKDMAYIRQFRKGSQSLKGNIIRTIIVVLVPATLYLIWEAVKTSIKQ